ncbi:RHS repeat-associated core domain-containing protein [Streptomyces sp. NPDC059575]|uniref:RHS repeat-associated core domain-containing protein n=1 Tax=Streptomyces sp. NPDC059575 TaxID=3346872 RepID=UPI0036B4154C
MTSLRGERSRTFANTDGSYTTRLYKDPQFHQRGDGSWAPVDTTVVPRTDWRGDRATLSGAQNLTGPSGLSGLSDSGLGWAVDATRNPLHFAATADADPVVTMRLDALHSVGYSVVDATAVPGLASGATVSYAGVRPDADLELTARPAGMKEDVVLRSADAPTTWVFPLRLQGLTASRAADGSIAFLDEKNTVRASIPKGWMEDSAVDPHSGDGAISTGVTLSLVSYDGRPAVRLQADETWLHDPARVFPVRIDPSVTNVEDNSDTYVEYPYDQNFAGDLELKIGTYDGGAHKANSFLKFDSVGSSLKNDYVLGAKLYMYDTWSASCTASSITAYPVTSSWTSTSTSSYPGPSTGSALGSASFARGWKPSGATSSSCPSAWEPIDLGTSGKSLIEGWTHGKANYGLALKASTTASSGWKKIESANNGSGDPYLAITYTKYGASYTLYSTPPSPPVTGSQDGKVKVKVTNLGTDTWTSGNGYKLGYKVYDYSTKKLITTNTSAATMPSSVAPNSSITLNPTIKALTPGKYLIDWDMYSGSTSFSSQSVPVAKMTLTVPVVPPTVSSVNPPSGYAAESLTPQLSVVGSGNNGAGVTYHFTVLDGSTTVADSGSTSDGQWPVPMGALSWGKSYTWNVVVSDGTSSQTIGPSKLTTQIPQPPIASHLGTSAGDHGFDPQIGNFTTAATDASVATVGPDLTVARTYNSLDADTTHALGAGWSSRFDMKLTPDADGSGNVVVTYPNGQQVRFGRSIDDLSHLTGVGDQNGDGVKDAVAVDVSTGKLWLYTGPDYSGTTRVLVGTSGWNSMDKLTGDDLNGDGIGDLVAVRTSDGTLWLYPGLSGGGFGTRIQIGTGGWNGMTGLTVTPPLGSDGKKDLVAVETSTGKLWAYPFASGGSLGSRVEIGSGGWNTMTHLLGGDFTGDGKGDVLAVDGATGILWTYPGTGTGTIGTRTQTGTGWNSISQFAWVGDRNGDHTDDFIALKESTQVTYLYTSPGYSGTLRRPTGNGTYTPPAGGFAVLAGVTGGGWTLTDKARTVYTFDALGRLTKITDQHGISETLTYDGSGQLATVANTTSGRALHLTWSGAHIATVTTDAVDGSALTWRYSYDGDELTQVCSPVSTTACTHYDYGTGSHYRTAVLDAGPHSYWRLGDASGTDDATSDVDVHQGEDDGTYGSVTLGAASPLAGSADTAATFNGTSSSVTLPNGIIQDGGPYLATELWFKTTSVGPLLEYEDQPLGSATTPVAYGPTLYIGADGKLRGEFWQGAISPITTSQTVTDGAWHHAVLSGAGTTQTLYLDGTVVGSLDGPIKISKNPYNYVGAGWFHNGWPSTPFTSAYGHFKGQIDDVALYYHALGSQVVQAHYASRQSADELTQVTTPGGNTTWDVEYDNGLDRVTDVTDPQGGTWQVGATGVSGTDTDLTRDVTVTDPAGNDRTYGYDPLHGGRVTDYALTDGEDRTYAYDTGGFLTKVSDENGHGTSLTHDARGNTLSRTACRDEAAKTCYTSYYSYYLNTSDPGDERNDKVTEQRDARSSGPSDNTYLTRYGYTADGNVSSVTGPAGSGCPSGCTISRTYTDGTEAAVGGGTAPAGLLKTSSNGRSGGITSYQYTAHGDLAKTTDPAGLVTSYTYDGIGRTLSETVVSDSVPEGATTVYTYDADSRIATRTDPAAVNAVDHTTHQARAAYTYTDDGQIDTQTESDLTGGDQTRTTTYGYDAQDRVNTTTDPAGQTTNYDYDQFGNRTSMTTGVGTEAQTETDYAYNLRDEPTTTTLKDWTGDPAQPSDPQDLVLESRAYDPAGRLASVTDAMGRTTSYDYYADDSRASVTATGYHDPDTGTTRDITLESDSYDGAGNLVKRITGGGKSIETDFTVDAAGRTTRTVLDPGGLNRVTTDGYDELGDVVTETRTGGGTTEQTDATYDAQGHPLSSSVHNGSQTLTTTWTLDQRGLPLTMVDPLGNTGGNSAAEHTTRYDYDALSRPTTTTLPAVQVERYGEQTATEHPATVVGYDTFGDRTQSTDPNHNNTTTAYDADGRPTHVSSAAYTAPGSDTPLHVATTTEYDALGRVHSVTDGDGDTTTYGYDQLDNLVRRTDPTLAGPDGNPTNGGVWSYAYDLNGEQLSSTDPTGAEARSTFDDLGRKITSTQVERLPAPVHYDTTTIRYDDAGNPTRLAAPGMDVAVDAQTTVTAYDAAGEATRVTDPNGNGTQFGYDLDGRTLTATGPDGLTTTQVYDPAGRMVTVRDSKAGTTLRSASFGYDANGNQTSSTDYATPPHTTTYSYDATGDLTRQVEPGDGTTTVTTGFGYDAAGNKTRLTDGRGNTTWYTFNSLGLQESTVEPATAGQSAATDRTWTTSYDAEGRVVRSTEPGGVSQKTGYDALGRVTSRTGSGAEAATSGHVYRYDLAGRLVSAGTDDSSTPDTFTYDDRGFLLSADGAQGASSYTYDAAGRVTHRTDASGSADFGYDNAGQLVSATEPLTGANLAYSYNTDGTLKNISYGNGADTRTYKYDDLGRPTSDTLTTAAGAVTAKLTYGWDGNGRLTAKSTQGTAGASTDSYGYDPSGRLADWTHDDTTTRYGWDAAGNLVANGADTATYDERNRRTSDSDGTYSYTARGTLAAQTGSDSRDYTYDAFDRLARAGGVTYTYDGLDRLATRSGADFSYAGTSTEVTGDGSETYSRTPDGGLLAVSGGGSTGLALTDQHNNLIGTFSPAASTLTGSTSYSPLGKPTATSGTGHNLGYQGSWTDPATGQVDMNARWYDPASGGFTSRDSWQLPAQPSVDANRYAYGSADPLDRTDSTGHWDLCDLAPKTAYSLACDAFWWELSNEQIGDDSCTGLYGMTCDQYYNQPANESVHDRFCDTHSWTSQCGGGGRYPYPASGSGGSHRGGGGRGGVGGGGGGRGVGGGARGGPVTLPPKPTPPPPPQDPCALHHCIVPAGPKHDVTIADPVDMLGSAGAVGVVETGAGTGAGWVLQFAVDTVAAGLDWFGQGTDDDDDEPRTCARGGQGWVKYSDTDPANGNRARGVVACLNSDYLATHKGSGTSKDVRPPGYNWAVSYAYFVKALPTRYTVNNCHLLGNQLSGSGTDLRNLATCGRDANDFVRSGGGLGAMDNMKKFETEVNTLITQDHYTVGYTTVPVYKGRRTVPQSFEMAAVLWDASGNYAGTKETSIPNLMSSPRGRKNLGTVIDSRDKTDVPTS